MILAEEAVGWTQVISVIAGAALPVLANYGRKIRKYVFELWEKVSRASDAAEATAKRLREADEPLERIENAQSLDDVKAAAKSLRKIFGRVAKSAETIAQETRDP